ncbi:MAG: ATP-binding protein [candidate division KSB1 bacterium]|nr:ATP-binding protein [candidate division KSB1 bacterium]
MTSIEKERERLRLKLAELDQIYSLSLELLKKSQDPDELLDALLDEYIRRFSEIPGMNFSENLNEFQDDERREKAQALILFAQQAALLKENADYQAKLKEQNRKLANLTRKLKKTNEELQRLNSHYLNMLSFVSHELRSPLISVLGFAELLEEGLLGDLNAEQRNSIQIIIRVTRNLIDMIRNYLDLAKIENGELRIHWQQIEVYHEILLPVIKELEGHLMAKEMKIVPDPESRVQHVLLQADPALLRIVFVNLFGNAIKYGKARTEIQYRIEDHGDRFLFSIKNCGKGVPKEKLDTIFEKFSQTAQYNPDVPRGTGLGLFNTKWIVEAHGGNIWAESEFGEWFRVNLTLPKEPKRKKRAVTMEKTVTPSIPPGKVARPATKSMAEEKMEKSEGVH